MAVTLEQQRRGAAQAIERAVEPLRHALRPVAQAAGEARAQLAQVNRDVAPVRRGRFGRGGRRGRAVVGDQVAQGAVGLVPHGGDHRHRDCRGGGRWRAGWRSPSFGSAASAFPRASCHNPPRSVESSSITVRRNSPLSSHTVGRPNTNTWVPSAGGAGSRRLSFWNMTQRSWAVRSRSAKYQCPLCHALNPLTSPRTHNWARPASTTARARRVTCVTVHAPSGEIAAKRSRLWPIVAPPARG